MSIKRPQSESVVRPVPQGRGDTVKARLPEPQFPAGVCPHPPAAGLSPGARHCTGLLMWPPTELEQSRTLLAVVLLP